jgi:Mg2+/citrate symporter
MEALALIVVGIIIGILFTLLWMSIRTWWRKSKDLRSSSVKARKEVQEKSLKAKQDAHKANDAIFRAVMRVFFLVLALVVVSWIVWTIIQI